MFMRNGPDESYVGAVPTVAGVLLAYRTKLLNEPKLTKETTLATRL
jgi:hypothetical protein